MDLWNMNIPVTGNNHKSLQISVLRKHLSGGFSSLLRMHYHKAHRARAAMKNNFMLLRSRWRHNPNCWNVGVEVVSFLRGCLTGNLCYGPPRVVWAVPELLVEEGPQMIAEFSSFLLWFLLILIVSCSLIKIWSDLSVYSSC